MRSPWIDLLRLHGYIIDPKHPHKPTTPPLTALRSKPGTEHAHIMLAKQAVASLRLCLGIGDGFVRLQ